MAKSHKELKAEYRQMKFPMGIYQLRNLKTGRVLLGRTTNLNSVRNSLPLQLHFGSYPNRALQQDWKAQGAEQFVFEIVEEMPEPEDSRLDVQRELKALEALHLENLKSGKTELYNFSKIN